MHLHMFTSTTYVRTAEAKKCVSATLLLVRTIQTHHKTGKEIADLSSTTNERTNERV